jgi:hypothetical protein
MKNSRKNITELITALVVQPATISFPNKTVFTA